jgi:hypothetical protein
MTTSEFAATVPPTPAEWAAMADNHLRALHLAYVIANGSPSALAGRPAKQMANVAAMLDYMFAEIGQPVSQYAGLSSLATSLALSRRRAPLSPIWIES